MTTVLINAAARRPSNGQAGPGFMPETDLVLPTIPASQIETINAFYRARPALSFPLAGHTATMTASWPSRVDDVPDRCRLDITVDGAPGALILSRPLLTTLIGQLDPDQGLDHLDPRHLALVLELALADALSKLEAVLGSLFAINSVRAVGHMERDTVSLGFRLSVDGVGSSPGELLLPSRHAIRFAQFLDQCAAGAAPAIELPIPVGVRVAAATCSVREIATLLPGDVVMADRSCHEAQTAVAVLSERLAAPVQLTAAGAQLIAPAVRIQGSVWEWSMENGRGSSQGEAPEKTDLDDIPVKLLFELGRIELSLAEVRQLAPGALIPVPRPLGESVDISANGRCIGRGSLVRIGDNVGVRITRLFHHA